MQRDISVSWLKIFSLIVVIALAGRAEGQQFDQLLEDIDLADPTTESTDKLIHGVVTKQNKYSIVVRSADQDFDVKLPQSAPIFRELIRPKFDLSNSIVTITLPCTGSGGDQSKKRSR